MDKRVSSRKVVKLVGGLVGSGRSGVLEYMVERGTMDWTTKRVILSLALSALLWPIARFQNEMHTMHVFGECGSKNNQSGISKFCSPKIREKSYVIVKCKM